MRTVNRLPGMLLPLQANFLGKAFNYFWFHTWLQLIVEPLTFSFDAGTATTIVPSHTLALLLVTKGTAVCIYLSIP